MLLYLRRNVCGTFGALSGVSGGNEPGQGNKQCLGTGTEMKRISGISNWLGIPLARKALTDTSHPTSRCKITKPEHSKVTMAKSPVTSWQAGITRLWHWHTAHQVGLGTNTPPHCVVMMGLCTAHHHAVRLRLYNVATRSPRCTSYDSITCISRYCNALIIRQHAAKPWPHSIHFGQLPWQGPISWEPRCFRGP